MEFSQKLLKLFLKLISIIKVYINLLEISILLILFYINIRFDKFQKR